MSTSKREVQVTGGDDGRIQLLTVEELAHYTRRSQAAVRAALKRGELPAVKLGRRWFVRRCDLERLFDDAANAQHEAGDRS